MKIPLYPPFSKGEEDIARDVDENSKVMAVNRANPEHRIKAANHAQTPF
jgi:hypothetical protein